MDWRDKTVSMGNVETETFDLTMATVTVSENRVFIDPKDVEDWERIIRELGEDTILREVHWPEVTDVSATVRNLYYPHIDISLRRQPDRSQDVHLQKERRIYFVEDEVDELQECIKTIRRFWNAWLQNEVQPRPDRREPDDEELDEVVHLQDALQENAANDETDAEPSSEDADWSTDEHVEQEDPASVEASGSGTEDRKQDLGTEEQEDPASGPEVMERVRQEAREGSGETGEEDSEDSEDRDDEDDTDEDDLDSVVDRFMND